MTKTQSTLTTKFPNLPLEIDKKLAPLTYFKIGGPAEVFVRIQSLSDLQDITMYCHEQNIPITVLGGASNIIVADHGIKGLVIQWQHDRVTQGELFPDHSQIITAGAGIKTALLVRQTIDWELAGLEYFLGVPGTLGGAVYNNAHYLNHLIGEYITRVQILDKTGKTTWLSNTECEFGYDSSRFHRTHEMILEVEFQLPSGNKEHSLSLVKEATVYRAQTQPLGQPSSGCIFQNTLNTPELQKLFPQFATQPRIPAGFLIDQAGLKGEKVGDIVVSDKHAAFFVNKGQGRATDVQALIAKVKASVKAKYGVELQEEVFYLG